MQAPPIRLSLAHLTLIDASPLELIDAAQAGGFDSIGLRIVAPMPADRIVPVIGDEAMIGAIAARLDDTGIDILDVEAIWLTGATDPDALLPALETAARLGARHVLTVGNDPDEVRLVDHFSRLCALAAPFGLKLMLEFIPYAHTRTVAAAHRVVSRAAQANAGVLVDALHLDRSGGTPADLHSLDRAWLSYGQLCDASPVRPSGDALRNEARTDRRYPGQGALPLADLLDALPPDIPLGIEAPCLADAHLPLAERARRCGDASRRFLAGYRRRRVEVS